MTQHAKRLHLFVAILSLFSVFCLIAASQPASQSCQVVSNISVTTSGLLTGSGNHNCPAYTWMLTAQKGQYIELIVRDYTSYDVATPATDDDPAAAAAEDDDNDSKDAANDGQSR